MEKPCLKNPDEYPDDHVLERCLIESKPAWDAFTTLLNEEFSLISAEWRYYRDGGWLFKVTKKKKTICWAGVYPEKFKTTFYFPERVEELITTSGLDEQYIDQFINGRRFGKTRAITVDVSRPGDLEATRLLIGIKERQR